MKLYEIIAVRTVERDDHLHVAEVVTRGEPVTDDDHIYPGPGITWPAHRVVDHIDDGRARFYTFGAGRPQTWVRARPCPHCGTGRYLSARSPAGGADVLLELAATTSGGSGGS